MSSIKAGKLLVWHFSPDWKIDLSYFKINFNSTYLLAAPTTRNRSNIKSTWRSKLPHNPVNEMKNKYNKNRNQQISYKSNTTIARSFNCWWWFHLVLQVSGLVDGNRCIFFLSLFACIILNGPNKKPKINCLRHHEKAMRPANLPPKSGQLPLFVPTTTVNYHPSAAAATTRKSTQKQQQQPLCSGNLIIEFFSHVAGHCLRINFKIYYTGFPGSGGAFSLVVEFLRPSNQSDEDTLR